MVTVLTIHTLLTVTILVIFSWICDLAPRTWDLQPDTLATGQPRNLTPRNLTPRNLAPCTLAPPNLAPGTYNLAPARTDY